MKKLIEKIKNYKLNRYRKDIEKFELTDKFNHGDPIMALLITILLFLLIMGIIYNGLINIREMIIIEKVRSKKS